MAEIEEYNNTTTATPATKEVRSLMEQAEELQAGYQLSQLICGTSFAPAHFKGKPEEAASAMLYGQTLGLEGMQSLRSIYVIHGTPALYSDAMAGIAQAAGHKIERESATEQAVVFRCRRKDSTEWQKVEWTISRAERAGYTKNRQYQTNPIAMLTAKCQAEAAKLVAPDALMGLRTVEDVQLEEGTEEVEAPKKTPQKKRTVQRKQVPKPELPEAAEEKGADDEPEPES